MVTVPRVPEAEVLGYMETLSNWGRWGPDDELGTLNYITPQKRVAAAQGVRSGRTVSLAHDLNTQAQPNNPRPAIHLMLQGTRSIAMDFIGVAYHGLATSHIDAFSHVFWERQMYNGRPAREVTAQGAQRNSVLAWRDGIVSRGVLLDVAAAKGREWLDATEAVHVEDLEEAERFGGVRVEEGDILIMRVGQWPRMQAQGWETPGSPRPGLAADCLPWLHTRRVAAYGGDCFDAVPSGYEKMPMPLHTVGLVAMGLPLLDNLSVEPLAAACREEGRYHFLLTVAPLRIPGGTGSPVNPIAVF
jgi:kynurenine formamidase